MDKQKDQQKFQGSIKQAKQAGAHQQGDIALSDLTSAANAKDMQNQAMKVDHNAKAGLKTRADAAQDQDYQQ